MLSIFFWLIFGLLSGWIVALASEPQVSPKRWLKCVTIGVVGAVVGGMVGQMLSNYPFVGGFNANSFLLAVICSVLFVVTFSLFTHKRHA